jgi:hypothetical protein
MPSPFPGMNPYLEHEDAWHNFHYLFPSAAMADLDQAVGPNYFVKADENVYVHELAEDDRRLLGRPDVFMGESREAGQGGTATLALAAPAGGQLVTLPTVDRERVPFIEIRDRQSRRLVTIIELLSPSNKKVSGDRDQYLSKRDDVIASPTHLVEIDLLRGGRRMPMAPTAAGDYGVLISRGEDRPNALWLPIHLRDPLPTIPIPLAGGDLPALLDLQSILHRMYDTYGFKKYMYQTPPDPPLTPEDAAWARGVLANVGITASPITPSA